MTANKIDVIDMACEEYSQEVLGFTNIIASGNSTSVLCINCSTSFSTLKYSFGGDISILEAILNSEPPLPPPSQGELISQKSEIELKLVNKNYYNPFFSLMNYWVELKDTASPLEVSTRFLYPSILMEEDYATSGPTSKKRRDGMECGINEENELITNSLSVRLPRMAVVCIGLSPFPSSRREQVFSRGSRLFVKWVLERKALPTNDAPELFAISEISFRKKNIGVTHVSPPLITHKTKWASGVSKSWLEKNLERTIGGKTVHAMVGQLDDAYGPPYSSKKHTSLCQLLTSLVMERHAIFRSSLSTSPTWDLKSKQTRPILRGDHRIVQTHELIEFVIML
ncbi:hypothetical protein Tco_0796005 [Tanacetum coccineum]